MAIFSVIAFSALAIAIVTFLLAVIGRPRFYWISAISIYVFSFMAGFSIGQLTVGLTFIPLALAIGFSSGRINRRAHTYWFAGVGALIGIVAVVFVDDYWTFWPFWLFSW
ncbi:hypothetical protein [Paenibacillus arenilitoris]|uniref:Uncharacterized protein n=1 Tax=Paenibacillus arenilitoris TaxID=2772299 RepID=A0A927CI17_9BACL|nr:hypothetical protein [Paenibacillus arenilitoris]MBD2867894.1 hypothetical protein [Paenibacillus arenilitoris]